MAVLQGFQYDGNEATFLLAEGAWTDNDDYKEGGSFAAPLLVGMEVALVTTVDYLVTKSDTGATPIGRLKSITGGKNSTNGRVGTVKLYGDFVDEVEVATASDAIAIGGSVAFSTSGGTYGKGQWLKDTANDTRVLASTSASGSIAAGTRIPVLFGAFSF